MFRITSRTTDGRASGAWRVLPGSDHTPDTLTNGNLFFPTLNDARRAVRGLNK